MQNALGNKSPSPNTANVLASAQKEVNQSPNTTQALPQSLHQLQSQFRSLSNYPYGGQKSANNAAAMYNMEVKTAVEGQPQLLLSAQQQNQQMSYFIKPDNNVAVGQ